MPSTLPPPYPTIYKALMRGEVIPFLGAGAPLYTRNPGKEPWHAHGAGHEVINYLPTAGELSGDLHRLAGLPDDERGELTRMAQYFEAAVGRAPLHDRLLEIFSHQQPPTPLHEFLASIERPLLVVTTNYDDMLERAYQARGRAFEVVVHQTEHNSVLRWPADGGPPVREESRDVWIDLAKAPVIYKMHGAIDRRAHETGQFVITEDDYIEFLSRMTRGTVIPPIFAEPFSSRPFLFLGYGLYDWNLRVILNLIHAFRGKPKYRSWAIETLTKAVEKRLWNDRGVDVYDGLTLDTFLESLRQQGAAPGAAAGAPPPGPTPGAAPGGTGT